MGTIPLTTDRATSPLLLPGPRTAYQMGCPPPNTCASTSGSARRGSLATLCNTSGAVCRSCRSGETRRADRRRLREVHKRSISEWRVAIVFQRARDSRTNEQDLC